MHACIGKGNGNPLQYSCLENPADRGAWWAAIYGVAQSRTRLKQLSSSNKATREALFIPWPWGYFGGAGGWTHCLLSSRGGLGTNASHASRNLCAPSRMGPYSLGEGKGASLGQRPITQLVMKPMGLFSDRCFKIHNLKNK